MEHIIEHIRNSEDWQLESAMILLKALSANNNNTIVKNIADTYVNRISLELHKRK